ncbi:MAG: flavodoxin domain-containing protein [Planctomycetes bacterium]|nr:flavodoxin domain-containing protein [Planctomycetota bacterium]
MRDVFKAQKVTDRVWWVGAIDWSVRDFHGYLTSRGTTYNAYLVMADRITLLDTVKAGYFDEMMARIASVVDPAKIEVIVSNHSEPDHSGELTRTIETIRPKEVWASKNGAQALDDYFRLDGRVKALEDGQSMNLGSAKLTFAETRMAHWPDSMVTYLHEDRLLFSQDAFGMHLASYERFADEIPRAVLDCEAAKYYANILLPLSNFVAKAIEKVSALNVPLDIIAPDHGPIWRKDPMQIVKAYTAWGEQKRTNKAIVVFDTMWKSTELMARAVGEGLAAGGARVRLMPMTGNHRSDVATEILDAGALVLGSPTINNEIFPTLADVLTYIRGLKPKGLIGAAFGSYGWSGESTKDLNAVLEEMKVQVVAEPVRAKYSPTNDVLKQCYDLGLKVAEKLPK